jgi:hypothetical protein
MTPFAYRRHVTMVVVLGVWAVIVLFVLMAVAELARG